MNMRWIIVLAAGAATTAGAVSIERAPVAVAGPVAGATAVHAIATGIDPSGADAALALPGVAAPPLQSLEYYPYDGSWTFVRIQTAGGGRSGFGFRRRGGGPGWAHDYPDAERNISRIIRELTFVNARVVDWGGNVLTFDDPRLMQYPAAYVSEPGEWSVTQEEIDGLRDYLLKGGFVMFDDFGGYDMYNLSEQMKRVLPELDFVRLEKDAAIFMSFFEIERDNLSLAGGYRGYPEFWGIYEDNDPNKRLMAVAGNNGDFGEFWEFVETGFYTINLSEDAYKVGVNYVLYALTH